MKRFLCGGCAAKIFGRSVQALAKIGEEIVITSKGRSLVIQAANAARSAFGSFEFEEGFFTAVETGNKPFTAIVNTKGGILQAFRFTANFERTVDTCELEFSTDSLHVRFQCKQQIQKTYRVDLIDGNNFVYNVDLEKYPNFIKGSARLFLDVVAQFHSKVTEVTLAVTADKLTLMNNLDESMKSSNALQSHVVFERREFDIFEVPQEAMDITFSLKTFKTILNYSENQGLNVEIHYDRPGAHVIVTLSSDTFRDVNVVFVFATLDETTPDVVQESRASQFIRSNELSIQPVAKSALQKITSQFDETLSDTKRRRIEDSDDDFDNLLESDEVNQLITQKEQEAREKLDQTSTQNSEMIDATVTSAITDDVDASQSEEGPMECESQVSEMVRILMQNHVKAKRGLLPKSKAEEVEVLVPASDDED